MTSDLHLLPLLKEFGIESRAALHLGLQALSNGQLVGTAVSRGFTCLLTRDRLLAETAARALKTFPEFAVVVVALRQRPWPAYERDFRSAWSCQPIVPIPGTVVQWPPVRGNA